MQENELIFVPVFNLRAFRLFMRNSEEDGACLEAMACLRECECVCVREWGDNTVPLDPEVHENKASFIH